MTRKLGDQPLDLLERRFQALQERAAGLPEASRQELDTALQELSQAIAALRQEREAGGPPPAATSDGWKVLVSQPAEIHSPMNPEACLGCCETILSRVFEAIPDLFTVIDRDFNIVLSNWYDFEHIPEAERHRRPKCYRVYHRRDRPCDDCHVQKVFATGQPQKGEKINALSGRAVEFRAFPILNESGEVTLAAEHARDITAHHLAAEALRESEKRFRTLIEDSPESLFLTDVQGTVLAASRVTAQRLGKNLDEIIGASAFDLFPPEVAARRRVMFAQAVATGRPVRFEDQRGDVHFDININPIQDADGKVSRLSILGINITKRKTAEQALKDSEARFRAIFATAQDSIFIKDRSFRYTQVNPAVERLFGRPAAEVIGKTDLDLAWAADTERIRRQDQRVLNGEVVKGAHTVMVQGVPVPFHYIKAPLYDDAGEIVGICGVVRDITDLKQAEAALKESEERFRMLFEHVPDAYILADMQGEIIDCNQATEELAGYGREELVGNNFACLPWLDFRQQVRLADLLAQTARGEVMGPVDFTLTRKDGGEIIAEGMSLPLSIQGQNLVLTIVRDITARKHAEAELFKNHLELQETAHRLEQSRNMLQLIIESIPVRVFWKDRDLRYLGCNTLFARDAGCNHQEQLLGKDDFAMGWREQADLYMTDDLQVMESRRPKMNFVEPQTTPAGARIWLKTSKVPLEKPNGEVFGVLGVYEDITAHKQAEEALRQSETTLRTLIEANPEALLLMDTQGIVLAANQAAARGIGRRLEEIIGADLHAMFPPEVAKKRSEIFQRVVASGQPSRFEDVYRDIHHDNYVTPIFADDQVVQVAVLAVDITARKHAEAALAAHLEFLGLLLDAIPNPIFFKDAQGAYLGCNKAFEDFLGVTRQEIVGQSVYDLSPKDLADEYHRMDVEAFQTAGTQVYESRVQVADGARRHVVFHKATFPDPTGGVGGLVGMITDITDLKQAEAALRESEERSRAIFEYAPVGIGMADPTGRFLQANQALLTLLGYGADEFKGVSIQEMTHPDDLPRCQRLLEDLLTGEHRHFNVEKRCFRKNGDIVWVQVTMALLRDIQGEPQYLIATVIDITARKQAEAELRRSEQRFRLMAETIQDVFWIATSRIGKTVYVSPGYEHIWGRTREALYRQPRLFLETVHPEDRERVRTEIIAAREQSIPWSHEYRIIRPDGTVRWIQNRGFPIRNDQGRVILFTGVATDVTEHKALEQQLLQAQKMEAVGRLAGGVAHDFNNLLMTIIGYGELMRAKVLKDDPLYGNLENILKAGDRAAALTQQLLTFSRQHVVHPQVIDLNRVVLDLEPMLGRLIGEDLHLEVVTDPRLEAVKADPGQLGQIIMNLVVNARDAMPQGGRLTLKIAPVAFEKNHHTRFGVAPPGAYVMLVVQDTGMGMDEATQALAFEPFFTTKEPGKGTGLGLSTVYGIVKQSGGYLDLASEPGAGSTVTIYFPRLDAVVEPPTAKIPITASFRGDETILLVEDEDVLRSLLAKFLRLYGYTVLEARHGGEALLTCERHPGTIHVMVTDVVMPQMSGRELADRLTPLRPEMKVLYMSGYTEDAMVEHGVADLTLAFLQKPFKPIELARRVHAVLHHPVDR